MKRPPRVPAGAAAAGAAALAVLAASLLLSCDGPNRSKIICDCAQGQRCISGRCVDVPRQDESAFEPTALRAQCSPPTQVYGGVAGPSQPPAPGTCSRPVVSSELPADWIVRHEARVSVGTELAFDVPPGAAGITVVLQAVDAVDSVAMKTSGGTASLENTAVPLSITDPTGQAWFDDRQPTSTDGSEQLVFYASSAPFTGTLTLPNTSRGLEVSGAQGLPAGTWKVVVSDYAWECATTAEASALCGPGAQLSPAPDFGAYKAGAYDVTILVRPTAAPATGTLDVALYAHPCPGGTYTSSGSCAVAPLPVSGFANDADLQRLVSTLGSYLSNAGLCLGTVTWYDLPAWAQERWKSGLDLDSTTPCDFAMGELLTLSAPGRHMNLFLMPTLLLNESSGSPGHVVGIDGTIPGPSGFSGTVQSGAAVSAEGLRDDSRCGSAVSLGCGPDLTAYIAAHETGHFLGLYHTSESNGASFDPLADTPICGCDRCAPNADPASCAVGTAVVSGPDCLRSLSSCGGGRNLMFWLVSSVSTGMMSPEQSQVVRTNPLVR